MPSFLLFGFRSPRLALAVIFILRGFMLGNWIARIPATADYLGVGRTELGSVLIAGAIGALVSFQVAAPRIAWIGTARAIAIFGVLWVLAYPLAVTSPTPLAFFGVLLFYGFVNGVTDVALNAQAVEIERRIHSSILSTMHGMFSVGAFGGGLVGGGFAALEVGIAPQFMGLAAVVSIAWLVLSRRLVPDEASPVMASRKQRQLFSIGPRVLWPLGAIAFCCGLVEEAYADWGALYLTDDLRTNPGTAALGFTIFSLAMLIGRLGGDRMATRLGAVTLLRAGTMIGGGGILAGIAINTSWAFMASFGLVGLGFSTIIPIVYRAAGSMPGLDRSTGVAAVATACYSAFLIGPPVMGFVADQLSLRASFAMVGLATAIVVVLAPATQRHSAPGASQARTDDSLETAPAVAQ